MTIKGNKEDRSAAVYAYFKQVREATVEQAASALDIPPLDAFGCIQTLTKHGLLGRDKARQGVYCCLAAGGQTNAHQTLKKIYAAMRINKTWTQWDIAQYSGATRDYVKKYTNYLQRLGHVEQVGTQGRRTIYRLSSRAPFYSVPMKKKIPDRKRQLGPSVLCQKIISAIDSGNISAARDAYKRLGRLLGEKA